MIGWTVLALLTCVHGGHMLDLLRAGGTSASEYKYMSSGDASGQRHGAVSDP